MTLCALDMVECGFWVFIDSQCESDGVVEEERNEIAWHPVRGEKIQKMETSIGKNMDLGRLRGSTDRSFDSCERPEQRDDLRVDGCRGDLHQQHERALVAAIQGCPQLP